MLKKVIPIFLCAIFLAPGHVNCMRNALAKSMRTAILDKNIQKTDYFLRKLVVYGDSEDIINDLIDDSERYTLSLWGVAIFSEYFEAAKLFLKYGVPIDYHSKHHPGYTLLMNAVDNRRTKVVAFLLEHGANAWLKNGKGKTALDILKADRYRYTHTQEIERNTIIKTLLKEAMSEKKVYTKQKIDPKFTYRYKNARNFENYYDLLIIYNRC